MKVCSKCKLNKPFSEFYKSRSSKNGYESACKLCAAERKRKQRKNSYNRITRFCPKCEKDLPYSLDFYPNASYCKLCAAKYQREWYKPGEKYQLKQQGLKRCSKCKDIKPHNEFGKNGRTKDGLEQKYNADCKVCSRARTFNQVRNRNLYNKYGITLDEYNLMLLKQNNVCLICNKTPGDTMVVDHDHNTGNVRGLLCNLCNRGLGMLGDDLNNIRRAMKYLEQKI